MRRSHRWIGLAVLALSIAACGKSEDEAKRPPRPVKDTVFGDLVGQKDKIKEKTEQAMQQRNDQLDQAMKKNEEPGSAQ